jgi:hypothetical protein
MEAEIKKQGKWEEYVKKQRTANKNSSLEDFEKLVETWLLEKESYVSESGEVEAWEGGDKRKIYAEVNQWIKEQKQLEF